MAEVDTSQENDKSGVDFKDPLGVKDPLSAGFDSSSDGTDYEVNTCVIALQIYMFSLDCGGWSKSCYYGSVKMSNHPKMTSCVRLHRVFNLFIKSVLLMQFKRKY